MDNITNILKQYNTFHLPEPIDYPSWVFDFEHDNPEKHVDMSRWDKIKAKFSLNKSDKTPMTYNSMWVKYGFSPSVYNGFKSEIKNNIVGNNTEFANFLNNGFFESNPDFNIHIFRAVRLYNAESAKPDDHYVLMGKDGWVSYFIMSDDDLDSFSLAKVKTELKLDDIAKIDYHVDAYW